MHWLQHWATLLLSPQAWLLELCDTRWMWLVFAPIAPCPSAKAGQCGPDARVVCSSPRALPESQARQVCFRPSWPPWVSQGCAHCTSTALCRMAAACAWWGAGDMCMCWRHSAVSILDYRKFWGAFSRYSWFICEFQLGICPVRAEFPGKPSIQTDFLINLQWRLKLGHHRHRNMKGVLLTQSSELNNNFLSSKKKYNKEPSFFALLIPSGEGERGARDQ